MATIEHGWRVPAFPVDGSKGTEFRQQIMDNLRQSFAGVTFISSNHFSELSSEGSLRCSTQI